MSLKEKNSPIPVSFRNSNPARCPIALLVASALLVAAPFAGPGLAAQTVNPIVDRITQAVDVSRIQALPNHHPLWASAANNTGVAPADLPLNQLTLVLSRSPQQEQAFEQLLADQQNPASPQYHHWLTPDEVGSQFGLSDQDIATISDWLQSQGLHVNWVSPSRIFIGFGGTASNVGHAFRTEMHTYTVRGQQRLSVKSDPMIPVALAPAIQAVRGLFTINEQPNHVASVESASPQLTGSNGSHFITPADFNVIYDVPGTYSGAGVTIGIVSWSRTNFADFNNFRAKSGVTFPNPTEFIPTAYGGIDPGPAYTAPPAAGVSTGAQSEATLDVTRSGSVAPGANLLLVASSQSGTGDGLGADAQYLVNTSPVPAQVMTISFGACESEAGPSQVSYWNSLFSSAAAEGISVFVSSGDSGAAGCDTAFSAPPATPLANSPNYICSSSYATCVGGTEFADSANPATYWSSTNGAGYQSVLSYIPEGAWNDSTTTNVAATGGGVSTVIATPSWQTGTGVPSARSGRYTPDVSFSASGHDGYFACMAAVSGGGCVTSNGSFGFISFSGTSAAAPGMAGVAALLDQKIGVPQGNLNSQLYSIAASAPATFHDATVASSGVSGCTVNTASMCNNSIPGVSPNPTQAGFLLTTGFDEATGLGSLDVGSFLSNYSIGPTIKVLATPASITFSSEFVGYPQTRSLELQNSGGTTLNAMTISFTGTNPGDFSQTGDCQLALQPSETCTMNVVFQPTAAGTRTATMMLNSTNATNSPQSVSLTGTGSTTPMNPTLQLSLEPTTIASAQSVTAMFNTLAPSPEYPRPTGSVTVTSGSFRSAATPLTLGSATIVIPGSSLAIGSDTLTAVYTPDSTSSAIYNSGSTTAGIIVVSKITPSVQVSEGPTNITTAQPLQVSIVLNGGNTNPAPTGSVTLTSGTYSSGATTLSGGDATINIAAGTLPIGTDTLTVTYTPDTAGSASYNSATGTSTVTVTPPPVPSFTVSGTSVTVTAGATTGNTSTITVTPANGFTGSVTLTTSLTTSPSGAQHPPTFSFGATTPVSITGTTAGTATLTISTTASQNSCTAVNDVPRGLPWYTRGGAVLACLLLFGIVPRRRKVRAVLGMLLLFVALAGGMLACGGGSSGTACNNVVTPGTTAGTYTITLTGTSGSTTANNTVTLTVQ